MLHFIAQTEKIGWVAMPLLLTPIKEVVSEIDLDATEKTRSSHYWNFNGVSWYNDITDIAFHKQEIFYNTHPAIIEQEVFDKV